jgi:hypothetical protein
MGYTFDEQGVRRIVAAVRRVEQDPRALTGKSMPIASGAPINWLPGYNNAGETIPAYSCVFIGAKTAKNGVEHNALTKPSTTFTNVFGLTVGVDSESGDQVGYHVETGFAAYDTGTPAVGETWGPKPSQFTLSKNYPGFRCLGIVDATAKIMLAERIDAQHLIGKRASNVSKGSDGEFTIWLKTGSSFTTWEASTFTLTAQALGAAYTANKYAKLELIAGAWVAGQFEC